uniref:Uncharacterized protein n=1 Tax=Bionectria ochroleuca TaxID=29856 RepID=A0A0B7JU28_BIOOC
MRPRHIYYAEVTGWTHGTKVIHGFLHKSQISNSTSNSGQGSGQGGSSTDRDTHYIDRADKNIRDFESKFTPKGGSGSGTSGNK